MARKRRLSVAMFDPPSEEQVQEWREREWPHTGNPMYAGTSFPGEYDEQEEKFNKARPANLYGEDDD